MGQRDEEEQSNPANENVVDSLPVVKI